MAPRFIQRYVKPQGEERAEMKHRNGKPAVRRKADIDRSRKVWSGALRLGETSRGVVRHDKTRRGRAAQGKI
jgi:hypothetical protein